MSAMKRHMPLASPVSSQLHCLLLFSSGSCSLLLLGSAQAANADEGIIPDKLPSLFEVLKHLNLPPDDKQQALYL